jgi:outer membrane lipoprotein-sorting protein
MKRMEFTAVLNESTEANADARLKKTKNGTVGVLEFGDPDPRVVHFSGKTLEIFYPKAKTLEVYDTGKNAAALDQFILLGFGTSGADLRKNYDLKLDASETVGGVRTSHLELAPKAEDARKMVTRIDLWIPEGQNTPLQEKLLEPSKNYQVITYSDVKINPVIPDAEFELKLPAGVKKVYPQK